MNAVWTANSGNPPTIVTNDPSLPPPYAKLNNGTAYVNLNRVLTNDFILTVDALHTSYSRYLWVGIFNATGTQGYGFSWDSSGVTSYSSGGGVTIKKFSVSNPTTDLTWNTLGTALGSTVASGHNPGNTSAAAISSPFAQFKLTWSNDTHTLQLSVDGIVLSTVTDSSFTSFGRVYLSGNGSGLYDNLSVATPTGATSAFTTFEAESGVNTTTGSVVKLSGLPDAALSSPELEASGKGYVALSAVGQSLTFTNVPASNGLTVRYCTPDAPNGGGAESTLNLYVNGTFRQTLTLSSKHTWLYGYNGLTATNGQSNNPASGTAHLFWDESRFRITGGLNKGDSLRFQVDAANTGAFYRIDCIDLETIPVALPAPANGTYLDVTAPPYNAVSNGSADATAAIAQCILDAKAQGKTVWIPSGTYLQSAQFTLEGVKVRGAGMWYTNLKAITEGTTWAGVCGFLITGHGTQVSDLSIDSDAHTARTTGGKAFCGGGIGWTVKNVWITHTLCGFWMSGANGGVIRDCRVRNTYADGININAGAQNMLVENNHVRGSGDDGLAILCDANYGDTLNNRLRYNSVIANWWGLNCDIAGGSGHVVEYNYFADSGAMGGLGINMPNAYPMKALSNTTIRRNTFNRCGGNICNQARGALWAFPQTSTVSTVLFKDNEIYDSVTRAIHICSTQNQQWFFDGNLIIRPGLDATYIENGTTGAATFSGQTVLALNPGYNPIVNRSSTFQVSTAPGANAPLLTAVASRKIHGTAGIYDLPLNYTSTTAKPTGPLALESRSGPGHTILLTFNKNIIAGQATVSSGAGRLNAATVFEANTMTVSLGDVTNAQTVTLSLNNLMASDGSILPSATVAFRVLAGDVDADGSVTNTDVSLVQAATTTGGVTSGNFRQDINASGSINTSDVNLTRSTLGATIP